MAQQPRFTKLLKHSLNRVTKQLAHRGIGPFSLVEHIGRKSGSVYQTPIILAKAPEGFVAELTYGDKVDWYRNITAAGECTVYYRGEQHHIIGIEPYSAEQGRRAFPAAARQLLKALNRKEFRLLRTSRP